MDKSATIKRFFYKTYTYHIVLLSTQVICLALLLYLNFTTSLIASSRNELNLSCFLIPFLAFSSILAGNYMRKRALQKATSVKELDQKLAIYHDMTIKKWLIVEASFFIVISVFCFSGHLLLLGVATFIFLFFIGTLPTPLRVALDLHLKNDEKALIFSMGNKKRRILHK